MLRLVCLALLAGPAFAAPAGDQAPDRISLGLD